MSFDFVQLVSGFGATICGCLLIFLTKSAHGRYSSDSIKGPQKTHTLQVPRIGGVAFFAGIIVAAFVGERSGDYLLVASVVALSPVFLFGLGEDLSKNVSPKLRLAAAIASGIIFSYLFDNMLTRTGLVFGDQLLTFLPLALFLTVLAISTLINAMNVIDGLNGLSIGSSLFIFSAITLIAHNSGDTELMHYALAIVCSLIGVAIFNFPHGRIFMGDSGAYILGGLVAFAAILVSERNADISPFLSLLLVSYPLYELLRSIVRRIRTPKTNVMEPDTGHLHSVVFAKMKHQSGDNGLNINARASCRVLIFPAFCSIWAVIFPANTIMLIVGICVMIVMYEGSYRAYVAKPSMKLTGT